jgi:hypothetical protein
MMFKFQEMLSNLKNEWTIRGKRKAKVKIGTRKNTLRNLLVAGVGLLVLLMGLLVMNGSDTAIERPAADLVLDSVIGTWSGTAILPSGAEQTYEIILRQTGDTITGEAFSSNGNGSLNAYLIGSYEDGWLIADESGGTSDGWNGVCYWAIELQTTGDESSPQMTGVFHRIANEYGTCVGSGTIELRRQ